MKKLILTLLNFFIVLTFTTSPIYAHAQIGFGGPCPRVSSVIPPGHVETGVGCVHTNPPDLAAGVIDLSIKIGGATAFLFLLMGAFRLVTSGGNPEAITHAKETMTSAIIGLLFIVFSVIILRTIGVQVLGLPGWQTGSGGTIIVP